MKSDDDFFITKNIALNDNIFRFFLKRVQSTVKNVRKYIIVLLLMYNILISDI